MVLKPLADTEKVLLFNDVAHPFAVASSSYVLRHSQSVEQEVAIIKSQIVEKGNYNKIGLLALNDDFGSAYTTEINKAFPDKTIIVEKLDPTQTDFKTNILHLKDTDMLIVAGSGNSFGLLVKQLKEQGYKNTIVTCLAFTLVPGTVESLGNAKTGIYSLAFDASYVSDAVKTAYRQKFNSDPSFLFLLTYTDVELIADAIKNVGDNPKKVADYLKKLGSFNGKYEKANIDQFGNIWPPMLVNKF
jgi:branched-chain amino acid transport system substrate-binding protein